MRSKFRLEIIKCRNDNATQKFYGLWMFRKVKILDKSFKEMIKMEYYRVRPPQFNEKMFKDLTVVALH